MKKYSESVNTEAVFLTAKLGMSDDDILKAKENPFKKEALKGLLLLVLVTAVPLLLAYIAKDSGIAVLGIELEKLFLWIPALGTTFAAVKLGPAYINFFDFIRARRLFEKMERGEEIKFIAPRISLLGTMFLALAVVVFVLSIQDANVLKNYRGSGESVRAECYHVDRIDVDDDTRYDAYFKYTFQGKEYTWVERASDFREGDVTEAFIDPAEPETLYVFESMFFFSFMMFMISLFFFWMENGWPKYFFPLGGAFSALVMCWIGVYYKLVGWKNWGIFFLILYTLTIVVRFVYEKKGCSKKFD